MVKKEGNVLRKWVNSKPSRRESFLAGVLLLEGKSFTWLRWRMLKSLSNPSGLKYWSRTCSCLVCCQGLDTELLRAFIASAGGASEILATRAPPHEAHHKPASMEVRRQQLLCFQSSCLTWAFRLQACACHPVRGLWGPLSWQLFLQRLESVKCSDCWLLDLLKEFIWWWTVSWVNWTGWGRELIQNAFSWMTVVMIANGDHDKSVTVEFIVAQPG